MKIAVASDLHLEFSNITLKNTEHADVLILAGDIVVAKRLNKFKQFFDEVCKEFSKVIYVAGNHEFYVGNFYVTLDNLKLFFSEYPHIYFLENQQVKINNVRFLGATMWTSMNNMDPLTLHASRNMLKDFSVIRDDKLGYVPLNPATTVDRHRDTLKYFKTVFESESMDTVVVTHHTPSFMSCHEKYKHDNIMNGCFHTDLSEFILDYKPKLWVHGHTHDEFDYHIGETRVVCNPRGYVGYEKQADQFNVKYLEV